MSRRHRRAPLLSIAAVAAGLLLLGSCGGDDDDDDDSTATTTEAPVISSAPTSAIPETTATTSTVAATPSTVAYLTEGASVMVTNASRVDGAAGRMSERLAAVGFTMVEPGNYSLGTLEVSKIYHDPANPQALAVAESLKAAFGGGEIEILEMGTPPPVDGGDAKGATVLVAMGNDIADKTLEELQGITTTTTAAPETTTADSTESTTASTTA
jgi:LytR cell envelope-related transcriptional attenuator